MIVRVQSPSGTKKFDVSEADKYEKLMELIASEFKIGNTCTWYLATSRDGSGRIYCTSGTRLAKLGLKHGDMLFLLDKPQTVPRSAPGDVEAHVEDHHIVDNRPINPLGSNVNVVEDDIDQELAKMDGQIKRKRNEQLCHHPPFGRCIHCAPLEPYDEAYLEHLDPPVKFMSFHAYLRKLSGGHGKGKFATLENLSCRVRSGCHDHSPWPDGICTKCQPSPITLEIQSYRHVDYVQIENGQLMEMFLDFWRQTGRQRIGLMLGHYAHHDIVGSPSLSIKAVVSAIYEPQQESTVRSVKLTVPMDALLPTHVAEVARRLGLKPVGWIFTDLVANDQPNGGAVKHYRGTMDTFFLSAEECVTAAHLQNLYPNICAHSPDGIFGSKFVTVVVTGDASNRIHFEAYQVSNQAMALERDNILVPTYDAPEYGYIRETTKEQFVPEVFYTLTDKYGNRVTRIARPLPVEYLLVDMPIAFPIEPVYTMAKIPEDLPAEYRFPIENRESLGQIQDFQGFARLLKGWGSRSPYGCLTNFHLLAWFAGNDNLPLGLHGLSDTNTDGLPGLLNAIASVNQMTSISFAERLPQVEVAVNRWASSSSAWGTVQELAKAIAGELSPDSSSHVHGTGSGSSRSETTVGVDPIIHSVSVNPPVLNDRPDYWACAHCTFHNRLDAAECDMCGLPQSD